MQENASGTIRRIAFWGIPISVLVLGLKLAAWYVTNSVALLSDALESTVNVAAALIAYSVVIYAHKPADDDHQFGHYKAEYLSAGAEGMMIIFAAVMIVWESVGHFVHPEIPDAPVLGLAINAFSAIVNAVWAWLLVSNGRKFNSPALVADGRHIFTDVVTSIGVLVGLILVFVTGYAIIDPLMAVLVALNILVEGWRVIGLAISGLMDRAVTPEENEAIKTAIAENAGGSLGVHDLRTRRAGPAVFIDFHLVVPEMMPVGRAHDICDRLEEALHAIISGASIAIHVEPEGETPHGIRVNISGKGPKKRTEARKEGSA